MVDFSPENSSTWKLNTSNPGKLKEFQRLFVKHGIEIQATKIDLKEIDADPVKVVVHKASQIGEEILIEDTVLEIAGVEVGINVRWLLDHLGDYAGHKAEWQVLLAYRSMDKVYLYKGIVHGKIVKSQGSQGFGFDSFFIPDGATQTLAENKPDHFNARALALEALIANTPFAIEQIMTSWSGPWQES